MPVFERVDATVHIDLRASGVLRAVAHDPTLSAKAERVAIDFDAPDAARVEARFRAADVLVPAGMSAGDTEKMQDNVRGREVLDVGRYPAIEFRGTFRGALSGGTLDGELVVRGAPRRIAVSVAATGADPVVATGTWEGTLTDLGIKPFKALLGAIKLQDWIRLRLRVEARPRSAP